MTPESPRQFLLESNALAEGCFLEVQAERADQPIWLVVTRHQGCPKAWLNVCPHQGRSLNYAPDRFLVDPTGKLICAAHGAVFEPEHGQCVSGPCRGDQLTAVPIEERDGKLFLSGTT